MSHDTTQLHEDDPTRLVERINQLKKEIRRVEPHRLAANTGSTFHEESDNQGFFSLSIWDEPFKLTYPTLEVFDLKSNTPLILPNQALLFYYFFTADGFPPSNRWISFTELPDGMFYTQAFQNYTGKELARIFQDDRLSFEAAAKASGGNQVEFGGVSYKFKLLPNISILVVFWEGDEDFPSTFQVLFDASTNHYLPTDACAIAGNMLARRIIKAHKI